MRLTISDREALERTLFDRLAAADTDGRLDRFPPVVADPATLAAVLAGPDPRLARALARRVDRFWIRFDPGPPPEMGAEASVLAWLAAGINVLGGTELEAEAAEFTDALLDRLPVAGEPETALVVHAVLAPWAMAVPTERWAAPDRRLERLMAGSPLTGLRVLDRFLPPALFPLGRELLPALGGLPEGSKEERLAGERWLGAAEGLVADRRIARWLRRRWLGFFRHPRPCRNVGLLLEALRRRGHARPFLLDFYEALDRFGGTGEPGARRWPLLETAGELLRVPGETEAAIRLNRRGNDYAMLFRPVAELMAAEGSLPRRTHPLLTGELLAAIRPLLDWITERAGWDGAVTTIESEPPERPAAEGA